MHPDDNEAQSAAPFVNGLTAWDVAEVLNFAEDIKAGRFAGVTFSHFCNDGARRLGVAIQHASGIAAAVYNHRDLAEKVREFAAIDAYAKAQAAAAAPAPAPVLPPVITPAGTVA